MTDILKPYKEIFGIIGDMYTYVGRILVQCWIILLWDHTERRETKSIPENIKNNIKEKINGLKCEYIDKGTKECTNQSAPNNMPGWGWDPVKYDKSKEIYDDLLNILDSDCVCYAKRDDETNFRKAFEKLSFTKILIGLGAFFGAWWVIFIFFLLDIIIKNYKDSNSITLGHPAHTYYYILFAPSITPEKDDDKTLGLWAHELVHVQQYKKIGFGSFAWRYAREIFKGHDNIELEKEANKIACSLGYKKYC